MMYWPIGAPRVYAASKRELDCALIDDRDHAAHQLVLPAPSISDENGASNGLELEVPQSKKASKRPTLLKEASAIEEQDDKLGEVIIAVRLSRSGHLFVTVTSTTLSVWQTKPTAVVASVVRSPSSMKSYGENVDVLLRPDSAIVVVQTTLGYLITYSLAADPSSRLYHSIFSHNSGHVRRRSLNGRANSNYDPFTGPGESHGIREISIQFRMVIKVDAGISHAIALDEELVVATEKPPALQCVRWVADKSGSQATTTLLKTMPWISKRFHVCDMVSDRPMNISTWITADGKCYAIQKSSKEGAPGSNPFTGHCFHVPNNPTQNAIKSAINARFSLIAIGCANSEVLVYTAKDYAGHIPLSHRMKPPVSSSTTGLITCIVSSPDGYSLFVGYENGWATWSVYGKIGSTSFTCDRSLSQIDDERWLTGVKSAFWIGGGSQLVLLGPQDNRLWVVDIARSAAAGCFSSANVARTLLHTDSGFMIYRGYDLPDLGTISLEAGLWHNVQIPADYLARQWPIKSAVISTDGRYVAVAGRRGLAHYSVTSGRWKTFEDASMEDEFTVRGGMCWHQHVLIAAVESNEGFQIRVYSRESALDNTNVMFTQNVTAAIVHLATSGEDSLLVYTYENHLYHFVITASNAAIQLVLVGQIALSGIIRAPPRVRALSWILPEDQLENGDPAQDVGIATILFLVDGKLVVLQPSTKESGELKYDMRIIAQNVEFYILMRDLQNFVIPSSTPSQSDDEIAIPRYHQNDLKDSLWYFDGHDMKVWTDTPELLAATPPDLGRELPEAVSIPVDFYPLSALLSKGILFGIEPDVLQRRDTGFVVLRFLTRTKLFIPQILRQHLAQYNSPSALYLAHHYRHLEYFAHSLEVLLHDVLDEEVDSPPALEQSLLPSIVTLLSSFPQFLDIVVQCTRKTEVRSWRTLFAHLPPPKDLFEESLKHGKLKTAGGYLLVLHNLDELEAGDKQVTHLLEQAKAAKDWELCKELARFLMALDESGNTLRDALDSVGLNPEQMNRSFEPNMAVKR